jgi:hypothetical protein
VAQLTEEMRHKLEGCGLDCRWRHLDFGPEVDSTSDGKEYQVYLLGE